MKRLTWYDVCGLEDGTRVVFAEPHDIFPDALVPAGATAVIKENGLNEIWCAMLLTPDDEALRAQLSGWDGEIFFGGHLDPGADGRFDPAWQSLSPLALP